MIYLWEEEESHTIIQEREKPSASVTLGTAGCNLRKRLFFSLSKAEIIDRYPNKLNRQIVDAPPVSSQPYYYFLLTPYVVGSDSNWVIDR